MLTHTRTLTHTHTHTPTRAEHGTGGVQGHGMGRAEDLGQGAQHAPEHERCWHEAIVNVIVALSLPKVTVSYSFILPAPSFLFCGVPASPPLSAHPLSRRRRRLFLQHTPGPEAGNRTKNKIRSNTEPNRTKSKVENPNQEDDTEGSNRKESTQDRRKSERKAHRTRGPGDT